MKMRGFCLLLALALLLSGCGQSDTPPKAAGSEKDEAVQGADTTPLPEQGSADPSGTAPTDLLLESYLTELSAMEAPVREYGESMSYVQMEGDLMARILYPVGDLNALDNAVEEWVEETISYYQVEAEGSRVDEDTAELTVEYASYLIEDGLVSVKMSGIYDQPYLAHPIDISASFNADRETGELLTLNDLLQPGGEDALRAMVAEQAAISEEVLDENLLEHWLLTPGGLEITLIRGEYLPMSDGTVVLLYPYSDLDGILSLPGAGRTDPEESDSPETTARAEIPEVSSPTVSPDPAKPMLALTFDDGPSAHTDRLLDIFTTYGGKGTFYVVGNMIDSRADTLRRMAENGHEIGGHSWNHRQLTKLSAEDLTNQFMSTRAKIYEVTGTDPTTMRPPYGSYNDQVKATAAELGITMINWSVDTLDWKYKDADAVYKAVMNGAKDGAIILCHDLHKTTVDAMERAVPDLIAQGYQLVTVSELLTSNGDALEAGAVYFNR